jgi:cytochrome b pre-mRNA-processing protein 3
MLLRHDLEAAKDAMLGFLFRGLTADPAGGAALFDTLTVEARRPHWFVEGAVPDTLDGRFAVLATLTALALVRLEREGEEGNPLSIALTERFIEVMESEHRELGLGDPTLGKTVRKLVGMLAKRTELWRSAAKGWTHAARESLYKDDIAKEALSHSAGALKFFSERLAASPLADLEQGKIG